MAPRSVTVNGNEEHVVSGGNLNLSVMGGDMSQLVSGNLQWVIGGDWNLEHSTNCTLNVDEVFDVTAKGAFCVSTPNHVIDTETQQIESSGQILHHAGKFVEIGGGNAYIALRDNKITLAEFGGAQIEMSGGKIVISANDIELRSYGNMTLKASGNIDAKGSLIKLNC